MGRVSDDDDDGAAAAAVREHSWAYFSAELLPSKEGGTACATEQTDDSSDPEASASVGLDLSARDSDEKAGLSALRRAFTQAQQQQQKRGDEVPQNEASAPSVGVALLSARDSDEKAGRPALRRAFPQKAAPQHQQYQQQRGDEVPKKESATRRNVLRASIRPGAPVPKTNFIRTSSHDSEVYVVDLHGACESCSSLAELRSAFENAIERHGAHGACSKKDPHRGGCLPLHCIGLNSELVLMNIDGPRVENFIFAELIAAHPAAVIEENDGGKIPFTQVLYDFAQTRRVIRQWRSNVNEKKKQPKLMKAVLRVMSHESFDDICEDEERCQGDDDAPHSTHSNHFNAFPGTLPGITADISNLSAMDFERTDLPPLVEWSLRMLSSIIERSVSVCSRPYESAASHLGAATTGGRNKSKQRRVSALLRGSQLDMASALGSVYSDAIVQKVAAIPNLLQELLLIRDKATRNRVFNLVLMKRVLLSEESYGNGSWLTNMMMEGVRSGSGISSKEWSKPLPRDFAEAAVYYLERISINPSAETATTVTKCSNVLMSVPSGASSSESEALLDKREACWRSVCDLEMIPNLLLLADDLAERVAATCCIQNMLDEVMALPIVSTTFVGDIVIHSLAIFAFRLGPTNALLHVVSKDSISFDPSDYIFWCAVLHLTLAWMFVREFNRIVAKRSISSLLLWTSLRDNWARLDLAWPFLCLFVSIVTDYQLRMSTHVNRGSPNVGYLQVAAAITTGLLWLKLLGHIKFLNSDLATFILCMFELVKDIKWFLFVILLVMTAFSQMCLPLHGAALSSNPNALKHVLYAYTIMLGDFESSEFKESGSLSILFVLYTFIVSVVLLNILIAIVSNCYEKAQDTSRILFGKVRLDFICSLMSIHLDFQQKAKSGKKHGFQLRAFVIASVAAAVLARIELTTATTKAIQSHAAATAEHVLTSKIFWLEIHSSLLLILVVSIFWFLLRLGQVSYNISTDFRSSIAAGHPVPIGEGWFTGKWLIQLAFAMQFYVIKWLGGSGEVDELNEHEHTVSRNEQAMNLIHGDLEAVKDQIAADARESARCFTDVLKQSRDHTDQGVRDAEKRLETSLAKSEVRIASIVEASEDRIVNRLLRELAKQQQLS